MKSVIGQWQSLGGFRTIHFFLNYARNNGWVPALVQAYKRLFWGSGKQYFLLYNRWYDRHNIDESAGRAVDVFSKPNVLIVGALDLPQCKKYRVLQKVELLEKVGVSCSIAHYLDVHRILDQMQMATQLLLYRVPDGEIIRGVIAEAARLGIAVGYDIDDPIFDVQVYQENPNLDFLTSAEKQGLLGSAPLYLDVIRQVDYMIVSTPGMDAVVKKHFQGDVIHWPNVIDGETLSILRTIEDEAHACVSGNVPAAESGENAKLTIGYMSGSRAHEQDFRIIEQPLFDIMQRFPSVRLMIGGYCELPDRFSEFADRIEQHPFVGYQGYFAQLSKADINVVPLVNNEFNECKSAIRFLEASMMSIPTIASAVGDFNHLIDDGHTGFLAANVEQWSGALDKLIEDRRLRTDIGRAAYDYVQRTNTVDALIPRIQSELEAKFYRRVCGAGAMS
jgi:glycosyltransferase involved in cell wall biosynthesis